MLEFVIFAVTVIIFLVVAVLYLLPGGKRVTTVPGPEPVDTLEGNFPDIASSGSLHEFLLDIHDTYGSIASFWWGPQLVVSIASAELFKEVSSAYDRPAELFSLFEALFGEGNIFYAKGAEARKRHAAYSRCFSMEAVRHHYTLFNKASAEFVSKWKSLPKDEHIPLRQYSMAFVIKTVIQGLMGGYFEDGSKVHKMRQAYDFVWNEMENRLRSGVHDPSSSRQERFDQQIEVIYSIAKEALKHRRDHPPGAGEYLLIDAVTELDLSERVMLNELVGFLVASLHTTALLLTWGLYFLASHPDTQNKLYKEVSSVLVGKESVDPENMKQLVYLHQVMNETLRCSVLSPWAARVQDFDIELGGHKIPSQTPILIAMGVSFQDDRIYPEPDKFDPERFSAENVKKRPAYAFEPFGFAGKRKCPGYQYAIAESGILLAEIIRNFEVILIEGQVITPVYGLVTTPKEEIWVSLKKRI